MPAYGILTAILIFVTIHRYRPQMHIILDTDLDNRVHIILLSPATLAVAMLYKCGV